MVSGDSNTSMTFGSAFRLNREDMGYQQGRLRMLCDFQIQLTEALVRQLNNQQRSGREIWEAKSWHENRSGQLEQELTSANRVVGEMRDWATQLQKAKEYLETTNRQQADWHQRLEETIQEQRAWIGQLEETAREQAEWVSKLEESKVYLEKHNNEQEQWIAQLEGGKQFLENHNRELQDWITQLEEGKAYLEQHSREQENWIVQLEESKERFAREVDSLRQEINIETQRASELAEHIAAIKKSKWWRLGVRLGLVRGLNRNVESETKR